MIAIDVASNEGYFQGELYIGPLTDIPASAVLREAAPTDGQFIVGHSETGHHHTVAAGTARLYETDDPLVAYLVPTGDVADLAHQRAHDTHATLRLAGKGALVGPVRRGRKITRQREMKPDGGWRKAAD